MQKSVILIAVILFNLKYSLSLQSQPYVGNETSSNVPGTNSTFQSDSVVTTTPAAIHEDHDHDHVVLTDTSNTTTKETDQRSQSLHISFVVVMSLLSLLVLILTIYDCARKSSLCNPPTDSIPTVEENTEYMDLTPQNEFSRREEQSHIIEV